jgi:hypothetical protein
MGGLDAVHAAEAYAKGYTGAGVTIGIVDFNFDLTSTDVAYNSASKGPDPAAQALYEQQFGQPNDPDLHGHAVAAVAAAAKNGIGIHGVAFDARVLAVDYFSRVNELEFTSQGTLFHISDPFTYLTSRGARIVNVSYGYDSGSSVGLVPGATEVYGVNTPAIAAVNGALLVASAGNNSKSEPATSNFDIVDDLKQVGIFDTGPGAFLIAGAVDRNNTMPSWSNRAGSLADIYLVAPASQLIVPWNGSLGILSGTSFAAPIVSGAAAVIMQRWPSLTAREVANILLQTATDLGAPGTDAVYGRGLVNIDAALQPLGPTSFAVADGAGAPVSATGLVLGTAFGDAPAFRTTLRETSILDSYGRDYTLDATGMVQARPPLTDLYGALRQKLGWRMGGVPVFYGSQLDLGLRANPADGIRSFGPAGGIEASLAEHYAVARFAGEKGRASWVAGTGLSLRDALMHYSGDSPFASLSLSQGFSSSAGGTVSSFAGMGFAFDPVTRISFGASQSTNQGIPGAFLPPQFQNRGVTSMMRLDRHAGKAKLGVELSGLMEEGGALGSLASGGLKMADTSATTWIGASYEAPLLFQWSFKGSMTLAATGTNRPTASLITSIGPVYATSFALGLGRSDIIAAGDAFSFAISQPMRAERAPVALSFATSRNPFTGAFGMTGVDSSLVPVGREIDFEAGYRLPLGDWNGGVNLAFSRDAGHVRGLSAVSSMFWLTRRF